MQKSFWFAGIGVCILGAGGCDKPVDSKQKAKIDVSQGEQDLTKGGEQRGLEDATDQDADKLTQEGSAEADFQKAIDQFSQAIEADPKSTDAYFQRGMAYLDHEDLEKAAADFTQVIELDPKNAKAYLMRSRAYGNLGDDEAAKRDRDAALAIDPSVDN